MKWFATVLAAIALMMTTAPAALARADAYYSVVCSDGNTYESVDAHAIEQGHKGDAIVNFSENTPFGLTCWPVGPFGQ